MKSREGRFVWCLLSIILVSGLAVCDEEQVSKVSVLLTDNPLSDTVSAKLEQTTVVSPDIEASSDVETVIEPSQSTLEENTDTEGHCQWSSSSTTETTCTKQTSDSQLESSETTTATSLHQATQEVETETQSILTDQSESLLHEDQTKDSTDIESVTATTFSEEQQHTQTVDEGPDVDHEESPDTYPKQPSGQDDTTVQPNLFLPDENDNRIKLPEGIGGEQVPVAFDDKGEMEGLTFSEWKQKVLAETEKEKQDTEIEVGKIPTLVPAKQRKKKNYASYECGAKLLAHNPEASNAKSVLNSNKDDYMNCVCKVKKWFVLELCEPIQVHSIEVASLELFSSQPKRFKVMVSDRYPTKDWHTLGEYDMREERTVQTFPLVKPDDYFAKYVRVEILEHYGDEHFCPLTIFRMLGVAVTDIEGEDDDNAPADDDDDDDDPDMIENEQDGSSKNLFESAKKTVIGLMKKVLNVEGEQADQINATNVNITESLNGTGEETVTGTRPCVPDANMVANDDGKEDCKTEGEVQPQPPQPGQSNIVRILTDDEQVETDPTADDVLADDINTDFVSMLQRCVNRRTKFVRKSPNLSFYYSKLCQFVIITWMKYYSLSPKFPIGTVWIGKLEDDQTGEKGKDSVIYMIGSSLQAEIQNKATDQSNAQVSDLPPVLTEDPSRETTLQEIMTDQSSLPLEQSTITQDASVADDIKQTGSTKSPTETVLSTSTLEIQSKTMIEKQVNLAYYGVELKPTPTFDTTDSITTVSITTPIEATPSLPNSWKPDTEDLMAGEVTQAGKHETKNANGKITSNVIQPQPASATTTNLVTPDNTELPDLTLTPDVTMDTDDDLDIEETQEVGKKSNTTVIDEKVVIDGGSPRPDKGANLGLVRLPSIPNSKRESTIMRLSNRIKTLEQNVSLSSRFLEELSRRYKKQSEDMMKMLNKTMAKLQNMTVESDVKNKLHEDEIWALEQRIQNLTTVVNRLTNNFDALNRQVTDRQMTWTTLQMPLIFFVMIFVMVFLHFHHKQVRLPPEVRSLIEAMPTRPEAKLPVRRNSISGPATPSKKMVDTLHTGGGLHRHSSETTLVGMGNSHSSRSSEDGRQSNDGNKKKKKKKHKNADGKLFSNAGGPYTGERNFGGRERNSIPLVFPSFDSQLHTGPFKERSNSLGTGGDKNKVTDFNGVDFQMGTKIIKGLSKKTPIAQGGKSSPKLMSRNDKGGLEFDVARVNDVGFHGDRIGVKEGATKGHRRQRSLPKQHYVETVEPSSLFNQSSVNYVNLNGGHLKEPNWSRNGVDKNEMKKSPSLPESRDSNSCEGKNNWLHKSASDRGAWNSATCCNDFDGEVYNSKKSRNQEFTYSCDRGVTSLDPQHLTYMFPAYDSDIQPSKVNKIGPEFNEWLTDGRENGVINGHCNGEMEDGVFVNGETEVKEEATSKDSRSEVKANSGWRKIFGLLK